MFSYTTTIDEGERTYYVVVEYQWSKDDGVGISRVLAMNGGHKYLARPWLHDAVCEAVDGADLGAQLVSHAKAVEASRALNYDAAALERGAGP